MKRTVLAISLVVIGLAVPAPAVANIIFTPFGGVTFGGDAPVRKLSVGASVTFMGKLAGLEFEFGYTPDFFGEQRGVALIASSNVTSLMSNLVIGPGKGHIRPYLAVGAGLLRPRINTSGLFSHVSANDFGVDAGVGALVTMKKGLGLRADVRFFQRVRDPSNNNDLDVTLAGFHFWRGTVGLSFTF